VRRCSELSGRTVEPQVHRVMGAFAMESREAGNALPACHRMVVAVGEARSRASRTLAAGEMLPTDRL
jgi:hypothetical protein